MNNQVLLAILDFRNNSIDINVFFFHSYLQKLIFFVRYGIKPVRIKHQKDHDNQHRRYLYTDYYHR